MTPRARSRWTPCSSACGVSLKIVRSDTPQPVATNHLARRDRARKPAALVRATTPRTRFRVPCRGAGYVHSNPRESVTVSSRHRRDPSSETTPVPLQRFLRRPLGKRGRPRGGSRAAAPADVAHRARLTLRSAGDAPGRQGSLLIHGLVNKVSTDECRLPGILQGRGVSILDHDYTAARIALRAFDRTLICRR